MTLIETLFAVLAGVFWGSWPLLLNRSDLPRFIAPGIFSAVSTITILALTFRAYSWAPIVNAGLRYALFAGVFAAIGTIVFLGKIPKDVGIMSQYYVLNLVVQAAVPTVYGMYFSGLSSSKLLGFVFVTIGIVLFNL